jgi:hypothetical protein
MTAPPLCRYCGQPIPKRTDTVFVRDPGSNLTGAVDGPLHSKEECQSKVNQTVVSVTYGPTQNGIGRTIWSFGIWDGKSYKDKYFCKGACATKLAYLMARDGHATLAYGAAVSRQKAKGEAA